MAVGAWVIPGRVSLRVAYAPWWDTGEGPEGDFLFTVCSSVVYEF